MSTYLFNPTVHLSMEAVIMTNSIVIVAMILSRLFFLKINKPIYVNVLKGFLIVLGILTIQNMFSSLMMFEKSIDGGWWPVIFILKLGVQIIVSALYAFVTCFVYRSISSFYTICFTTIFVMVLLLGDVLLYWNIVHFPPRFFHYLYAAFLVGHLIICVFKRFANGKPQPAKEIAQPVDVSRWVSFCILFFISILIGIVMPLVVFHNEHASERRLSFFTVALIYSMLILLTALPSYFLKPISKETMRYLIGLTSVFSIMLVLSFMHYMAFPVYFDWWLYCFPFLPFFISVWLTKPLKQQWR